MAFSNRAEHIPTVVIGNDIIPDWINATYANLQNHQIRYTLHEIQGHEIGNPDSIAYKNYQDSSWWWLICTYNGIINPIVDMVAGDVIRIPNLQDAIVVLRPLTNNLTVRDDNLSYTTI